jgi:hypothetical protein
MLRKKLHPTTSMLIGPNVRRKSKAPFWLLPRVLIRAIPLSEGSQFAALNLFATSPEQSTTRLVG